MNKTRVSNPTLRCPKCGSKLVFFPDKDRKNSYEICEDNGDGEHNLMIKCHKCSVMYGIEKRQAVPSTRQ